MTSIPDRVRNSNAYSDLSRCKAILDELSGVVWEAERVAEFVSRSEAVVDHLMARMALVDAYLVPLDSLGALHGQTQGLVRILEEMQRTQPRGPGNLDVVHRELDTVLSHANGLPAVPISTPDDFWSRAVEQLTQAASQAQEDIEKAVDNAKTQFEELSRQVTEKSTEFGTREQELTNRVSQASERIEREVTSIQGMFRQSQGSRDEEFQQSQTSRNEEFHAKLDETVAQVESFRDQARSMLEEVAGAGTAQHYSNNRDAQRKAADMWRWIGIGVLILTFVAAVGIFLDSRSLDGELSLVWALARTGVLAVSGGSAAYILRQSGQHRRREEEMSRVANELLLLGPFLNRLDDTDRQALLKEITPLYFRGGLPARNTEPTSGRVRGAINRTKTVLGSEAQPDDR